jgi:hypothetical protein
LELNKNGTYKYTALSWFENLVLQGKWGHSGKVNTLSSYEICEIFICDAIQSKIAEWPANHKIKITDNTNESLIGVDITNTKTGKKYYTDINGLSEIKQINKKIKFKLVTLDTKQLNFQFMN